jgi:hypothetical protein
MFNQVTNLTKLILLQGQMDGILWFMVILILSYSNIVKHGIHILFVYGHFILLEHCKIYQSMAYDYLKFLCDTQLCMVSYKMYIIKLLLTKYRDTRS